LIRMALIYYESSKTLILQIAFWVWLTNWDIIAGWRRDKHLHGSEGFRSANHSWGSRRQEWSDFKSSLLKPACE
jgi:hypothetical protein